MFYLIIAAVIGTVFAFLATQNTLPVQIHLGGYTWSGIPLYGVAIVSLLVGLVISWLLSIVNWASSSLVIRSKEVRAKKAETGMAQLQSRIQELENKNTELEAKLHEKDAAYELEDPSPLHRIKHSLSR